MSKKSSYVIILPVSSGTRTGASEGMAIAGLICSIIAIAMLSVWCFLMMKDSSLKADQFGFVTEQTGVFDLLEQGNGLTRER